MIEINDVRKPADGFQMLRNVSEKKIVFSLKVEDQIIDP